MRRKRGLIFALDAALAVTVVVIMVINSSFYFSTASRSSLSHLQLVNLGNDIVTIFDYAGLIDEVVYNASLIQGPSYEIAEDLLNISQFVPANYEMWVSVSDIKETLVSSFLPAPGFPSKKVNTEPLERVITTSIEVNVSTGIGGPVTIRHTESGTQKVVTMNKNVTYVVGKYPFYKGQNQIEMSGATNVYVHWLRVLGTEAYAGSTNESFVLPIDSFPKDKFIGAGERIVTASKKSTKPRENPIEGTHIVRYKIWLKGEAA